MQSSRTEQVIRMYKDVDKISSYLKMRFGDFKEHYPQLSKESSHIFLYEVVARIADILEEDLQMPRSTIFELLIDNDEYNRYQKIKAINLKS